MISILYVPSSATTTSTPLALTTGLLSFVYPAANSSLTVYSVPYKTLASYSVVNVYPVQFVNVKFNFITVPTSTSASSDVL